MRFLKPIDEELLHTVFQKFSKIITLEDGTIQGGLGSAVAEFMADHQYHATIKRLGIPDKFIEHGTQQQLYEECGFDEKSITRCIQEMLIKRIPENEKRIKQTFKYSFAGLRVLLQKTKTDRI